MHLDYKILDDRLRTLPPTYATPGSAGLDLRACLQEPLTLAPNAWQLVPTGMAIHLADAGYAAMIWNLDQAKSMSLCGQYKAEGAACDVMPDTLLLQMAAMFTGHEAATYAPELDFRGTIGHGEVFLPRDRRSACAAPACRGRLWHSLTSAAAKLPSPCPRRNRRRFGCDCSSVYQHQQSYVRKLQAPSGYCAP